MSKYYVIIGWKFGADREVEICKVENNPDAIVKALTEKRVIKKRKRIPQYSSLRVEAREKVSA
jgi:hypothetical protein